MKTAISLPDAVYHAAERVSRRKHMSRSEFYATAIRWYVAHVEKRSITDQLDAVYAGTTAPDVHAEAAAIHDLPANDWTRNAAKSIGPTWIPHREMNPATGSQS